VPKRNPRRETRSGVTDASAICVDCSWSADGRNAIGIAAQHHDRTGHSVEWQQIITGCYGPERSTDLVAKAIDRHYDG